MLGHGTVDVLPCRGRWCEWRTAAAASLTAVAVAYPRRCSYLDKNQLNGTLPVEYSTLYNLQAW
jgi:hypothetical protein